MSCAKTAELIEVPLGMLSRVGSGNPVLGWVQMIPWEGHFWGVWWIDKHCIGWLGKR